MSIAEALRIEILRMVTDAKELTPSTCAQLERLARAGKELLLAVADIAAARPADVDPDAPVFLPEETSAAAAEEAAAQPVVDLDVEENAPLTESSSLDQQQLETRKLSPSEVRRLQEVHFGDEVVSSGVVLDGTRPLSPTLIPPRDDFDPNFRSEGPFELALSGPPTQTTSHIPKSFQAAGTLPKEKP